MTRLLPQVNLMLLDCPIYVTLGEQHRSGMYLAFVVVLRHRCDFKQYVYLYWVEGENTCSVHMNPRVFYSTVYFRNQ